MPKVCYYTGKKVAFGNKVARSGAAIKKGGFGLHVSGISRRRFGANLQKLTALVDGKPQRITVSTRAIKSGLVTKPLKRKYGYTRQQKEAGKA